ncbi:hypothetical protein [Luteolibacter sp. AS25]|uniref:hypothetical protein n=1 Tax=Luteolibacter sp. AS25 TaxID=3135776 RepID=UPI00398AC0DF
MDFFRSGRLRFLYLLALLQLIGGPLVLLNITVFSKITLQETPRLGLTRAAATAWKSPEFQTVLTASVSNQQNKVHKDGSDDGKRVKPTLQKQPDIPWQRPQNFLCAEYLRTGIMENLQSWTPAWPNAPPGPPPKMV